MSKRRRKGSAGRTGLLFGMMVLVIAFVTILGGCSSATPKAQAAPEEPGDAVEPTLLGTWTTTGGHYNENDEHIGSIKYTLTFTKSRWIEHRLARLDDGTLDGQRATSGAWEVDGSTITRTWLDYDDEQLVEKSVGKQYVWASEDVVFIHQWPEDRAETRFWRYTRVRDPIPGSIVGTWGFEQPINREEGQSTGVYTFTIDENTFTEHYVESGTTSEVWILRGSIRHVPDENQFHFTVNSGTANGIITDELSTMFIGHELRVAFAPTGIENQVAFSYYYHELKYDSTTDMWVNRHKYGSYGRFFFLRRTE